MAEKQIGVKLDVKQTGLQQVDAGLDSIAKNLKNMNESVLKQQQKGWGSESQTKEMREQLRYMDRMVQLYERMARTQGRSSESFGNFRSEIGGMQRDLGSVPSYRSGSLGGAIHQRFGENAAQSVEKLTSALGKLGAIYTGISVLGTIHSSLGRGDQLSYGYGDVFKRMGGSGSALKYGNSMIRGLNGYGYDDMQAQQATTQYSTVTGRMNPNDLKSQMQAIMSTGRRFGWDIGQATSTFSDAFSNGVTGGSGAQMNPQQFATLVANATSQAHMQGREGQLVSQLAQVTQMTIQNTGQAGNQGTLASLLAMGDRTGNQAIIGNLPGMLNNVNQGITNPSGGYGAQALMMRAIGGGKTSFWQEQYQQSLGIDGASSSYNGKTNIENATNYLMKTFTGDKYRQASMLGQMFNMNPAQAMQYIDTYTKNGQFDSSALNQGQSQMSNPVPDIPLNDAEKARNNQQNLQSGADAGVGNPTTGVRTDLSGLVGDALGSPVGTGLAVGGGLFAAGNTMYNMWNFGSKLLKGGSKLVGGATGAASEAAGAGGEAGAGLISKLGGLGKGVSKFLGPLGTLFTAAGAVGAGQTMGDWAFGHQKGMPKPMGVFDGFSRTDWEDDRPNVFSRMYNGYKHGTSSAPPTSSGSPSSGNTAAGVRTSSMSASTAQLTPDSSMGSLLAPVVVSTIVALQPYMGQIRGLLGSDSSSGAVRTAGYTSNPRSYSPLMSAPNRGAGTILAGLGGRSGGATRPSSSGASGSPSYSGAGHSIVGDSGASASSIDQMLKGTSLEGHGQDFIDAASEYGIDPAALVGIVKAEQSFTNPYGSNNLTGITSDMGLGDGRMFGANDGQKLPGFATIKDGLRAASKNLQKNYAGKGITDVGDVAKKWVGNSNSVNEAATINNTMDELSHKQMDSPSESSGTPSKIKINDGSLTITLNTENGTQKVKAPISAEYTGIASA